MKVIIRVDDVDQESLFQLSEFFRSKHPDVPVSVFLFFTHTKRWCEKGWKELKFLINRHNWEVGGHSRNHLYLSLLDKTQLKYEIQGNIMDIYKGLGKVGFDYRISSFAYPFGNYDENVVKMLKKNEIDFGLTFPDGFPYKSALKLKEEEPLKLGITISDRCSSVLWNTYFDKALAEAELYILCLHTKYWSTSIKERVIFFNKRKKSIKFLLKCLWKDIFHSSEFSFNTWEDLDKHLKNIKSKRPKIQFSTFKDLLPV